MLKYLGILLFCLTLCLDAGFAKSTEAAKQDLNNKTNKKSKNNSKQNPKDTHKNKLKTKAKEPKGAKNTKEGIKKNDTQSKAKSKSKSKQKKPAEPVLVSKIPTYLDETPESLKEKPSTLETHMQKLRTTLALECEMLNYELKNPEESKSFEDRVLADVVAKNPDLALQQDKPLVANALQGEETNAKQMLVKENLKDTKDNLSEEPKVKKKLILQPL